MSTLRLILDGRLLELDEHSDLSDASITIQRADDSGNLSVSYSGNITYYGRAANEIADKLLTDPNFRSNTISVELIDTCCNNRLLGRFKITYAQIDYCEYRDGVKTNCEIAAGLIEATEDSAGYQCLNRILISDDSLGFRRRRHPFVRYCTEPSPVIGYVVLFVLANIVVTVLYLLIIVLSPIIAIIQAVNTLPGVRIRVGGDPNLFRGLFKQVTRFASDAYGCGRGHFAPYLKDLIQNACDVCGLQFRSSILNNPDSIYTGTMYFNAPGAEGAEGSFDSGAAELEEFWIYNGPIINALAFIREVCTAWNADFVVQSNELVLERKDYFGGLTQFIDLTLPENEQYIVDLCTQYNDESLPNYAKIQAQFDGTDWVGNQALQASYRAIVDYEPPVNPNLSGERLYQLPYAAARFRDDGVQRPAISPAILVLISFITGVASAISTLVIINRKENQEALLMQSGTTTAPKYLVRDPNDNNDSAARTIRQVVVSRNNLPQGGFFRAFEPNRPLQVFEEGQLWQEFYAWENPQNAEIVVGMDFSITLNYECRQLPDSLVELLNQTIRFNRRGQIFNGRILRVVVAADRTLTLTGTI